MILNLIAALVHTWTARSCARTSCMSLPTELESCSCSRSTSAAVIALRCPLSNLSVDNVSHSRVSAHHARMGDRPRRGRVGAPLLPLRCKPETCNLMKLQISTETMIDIQSLVAVLHTCAGAQVQVRAPMPVRVRTAPRGHSHIDACDLCASFVASRAPYPVCCAGL